MKGITDILGSLFSSPSGATQSLTGKGSIPSKDGQPKVASFEDVLAQMASEEGAAAQVNAQTQGSADQTPASTISANLEGNGPAPSQGSLFESLTTFSELDIQVSEHVQVSNAGQLAQAEHALVSFASSLAQLINLVSNLQNVSAGQAQNALVSLGAGAITPDQAQSFLDSIRALVQKLPEFQNPLMLPSDQQSALLNQVLQQMIQNQQILFGSFGQPAKQDNVQGVGAVAGTAASDVFLQMSFSDAQFAEVQQTNNQTSQVFINLQTFQMAATFVQLGGGQLAVSNDQANPTPSFQPIALSNNKELFRALDQALAANVSQSLAMIGSTSSANSSTPASSDAAAAMILADQGQLNQNLKNLVQMLAQAGVSQAVLTSVLNNQPNNPSAGTVPNVNQAISMDQVLNSLLPSAMVPPPAQPESQSSLTNDFQNGSTSNNRVIAEQFLAEASVAITETQVMEGQQTQPLSVPRPESLTAPLIGSAVLLPAVQTPELTPPLPGNMISPVVNPPAHETQNAPLTAAVTFAGVSPTVTTRTVLPQSKETVLDLSSLQALNEVVARLNLLGAQTVATPLPVADTTKGNQGISLGQILNSLISAPLAPSENQQPAQPQNNQNPSSILFPSGNANPIQTTAVLNEPIQTKNNPTVVEVQQTRIDVTAISQTQLIQAATNPLESSQTPSPDLNNPVVNQPNLNVNALNVPTPPPASIQATILGTPADQSPIVTPVNVPVVVNATLNPIQTPVPPAVNQTANGLTQVPNASLTNQDVSSPNPVVNQVKGSENAGLNLVSTPSQPLPVPVTPVPVSAAQNVPASVVTGEAVKLVNPAPLALKNADLNTPAASQNLNTVSEVKPVTPAAVNPVALNASPSTDIKANLDDSKTTNNNSNTTILPLLTANLANLTGDKTSNPVATSNANVNNTQNKTDSTQVLNQVVDQITVHASEARAVSRMSFQLIPESLGRVTVQIALVDQSLSARFIVSNPVVKETLQHHMIELKTALNQSGLQIDQLQVQVQGGGSNLLAQYYQYQQEGFGSRLPGFAPLEEGANNGENTGVSELFSTRNSLVDMLV